MEDKSYILGQINSLLRAKISEQQIYIRELEEKLNLVGVKDANLNTSIKALAAKARSKRKTK